MSSYLMQQHHFNGERFGSKLMPLGISLTECRQTHAVDPLMPGPHADSIMNSDDAGQGFMNSHNSSMNHSTSSHNRSGCFIYFYPRGLLIIVLDM